MKKILKSFFASLLITLSIMVTNISAQSDVESAKFNIEAVEHKDQLNKDAGYFHLNLSKDKVETIEIQINNNSNEKMTYTVKFDVAKTNINGLIVYNEEGAMYPNNSLKYAITDLVKLESEEIVVEPWSSKKIKATIDFTDIEFDGVLLGAFTVYEKVDPNVDKGIGHVYEYELGLALTQKGNADLPNSETLELGDVKMDISSGHRVLYYEILNLEAEIARNLRIESSLVKIDENNKELFNEKVENFSIAPNGILPMQLDWGKKDVEAGKYRLILRADDENNEWNWTYEFDIKKSEAKNLNEKATYILRYPNWTLTVFLILGALTVINSVILTKRMRRM